MKGRCAIRGCSQLELTPSTNKTGLWSLPDDVAMNCLLQVSRLDLAALAIASKRHRSLIVSPQFRTLRWQMGSTDPYFFLLLHIFPDPSPRWFILHPAQRRLKRLHTNLYPTPESGSSFVATRTGFFVIGGLMNGKPTSDVTFFCCVEHRVYPLQPMKMARCGASASLIGRKVYVFGGCWDVADSSNWVEVFDITTLTWDFLFVSTLKMPLKIQQCVVIYDKEVYAVDEDGQNFSFSPSKPMFVGNGETDSKSGYINDWCLIGNVLFCHGSCRRILWCLIKEFDWKEVKGLEKLQYYIPWGYDISKLCINSAQKKINIFWEARPQGPEILELRSAEISLGERQGPEGFEIWGKIEWCGAVLSESCVGLNLLYAGLAYA